MTKSFLIRAVAAGCAVLLLMPSVSAWAHHSFASEYDADRPAKTY